MGTGPRIVLDVVAFISIGVAVRPAWSQLDLERRTARLLHALSGEESPKPGAEANARQILAASVEQPVHDSHALTTASAVANLNDRRLVRPAGRSPYSYPVWDSRYWD